MGEEDQKLHKKHPHIIYGSFITQLYCIKKNITIQEYLKNFKSDLQNRIQK